MPDAFSPPPPPDSAAPEAPPDSEPLLLLWDLWVLVQGPVF